MSSTAYSMVQYVFCLAQMIMKRPTVLEEHNYFFYHFCCYFKRRHDRRGRASLPSSDLFSPFFFSVFIVSHTQSILQWMGGLFIVIAPRCTHTYTRWHTSWHKHVSLALKLIHLTGYIWKKKVLFIFLLFVYSDNHPASRQEYLCCHVT